MRTAEEILIEERLKNRYPVASINAMKQYAKEALEEAAERATITGREWPYYRGIVDKQSILSLIHELK